MYEQSKAAKRRFNIGSFITKYFIGHGIDVGCGPDSLARYAAIFPGILSCDPFDLEHGDAQYLQPIEDNTYGFLHASHCLEHMRDVEEALSNWIRVVKPGGHLVITVPDEDMYEQGKWPSLFNPDHKWSFTICKESSWCEKSINILVLLRKFVRKAEIIKVEKIEDFYRPDIADMDQTLTPVTESCIEIILRKRIEERVMF